MSEVSKAIEIFKKREKYYKSIDVRIAATSHEDSWYNVRTRVLLSHEKAVGLAQKKIDVNNFMVLFENIRASSFPSLLETINRDEFEVDGIKINFFAETQHNLSFEDSYRESSERANERWSIDWSLDVFKWAVPHKFANEMRRTLEDVSLRLNCYEPAYEDVYKAVRGLLGLPEYGFREYDGRESICYILLPDYLAIENCRLQGDQLDYEIKFHPSIDVSDLRLNVIAKGKTIKKHQETFSRNQVQKRGAFRLARDSMTLRNTADAQLYLFSKGTENEGPSDRRYVRNLRSTINSRLMANEVFGADVEKLTAWLRGLGRHRSERAHNFEHAVTVLFHICGFSTEWLDLGNLAEDAPDILIFCHEPQALIVGECKTDIFGWKETRKLKARAKKLSQELKIDTYPVMFTCIEPNDIDEQTKERARNERITILSSLEIDEILKMGLRGNEARDVLKRYFHYGLTHPLK